MTRIRIERPTILYYLVAAMAIAALLDISRVGFFADDFLFLDAARRHPPSEVLLGQYGIYPWYRPLSREFYFYAVLLAGQAGRALAIVISLSTASIAAVLLFEIGKRLGSQRVGAVAAALLVSHALTKLLVAWGSGYQDLLSMTLVLGAVVLELRGATRIALFLAFLAPFAKETGAIAVVLVGIAHYLRTTRRPGRRFVLASVATIAAAALIHLGVRAAWTTGGNTRVIQPDPLGILKAVGEMFRGFLAPPAPLDLAAIGFGLAFGFLAWRCLSIVAFPKASPRRARLVLAIAGTMLGLAPLVFGNLLGLSVTNTYYAYPAVPWLCLALAEGLCRMPRSLFPPVVVALLAWNAYGLAFRLPNLERIEGWFPSEPSWEEATRISTATERFAQDLRSQRSAIPHNATILYSRLPVGSFFVLGDDGAATREMLGDASVKAYFISSAPSVLDPETIVLVTFDSHSRHLRVESASDPSLVVAAALRLAMGDAGVATILGRYARPLDARMSALRLYVLGGAALMTRADHFSGSTTPDSERAEARLVELTQDLATWLAPDSDSMLVLAYGGALSRFLEAAQHRELASLLLERGRALPAALELRIAVALDGGSSVDYVVLGGTLEELGLPHQALAAYDRAAALATPGIAGLRAQQLRDALSAHLKATAPRDSRHW